MSPNPAPNIPQHLLFYLLGEPASFLVVTNTPPIRPCPWSPNNCPTLRFAPFNPFTPHCKNYIIYIDVISNLSHLRPGHLHPPPVNGKMHSIWLRISDSSDFWHNVYTFCDRVKCSCNVCVSANSSVELRLSLL